MVNRIGPLSDYAKEKGLTTAGAVACLIHMLRTGGCRTKMGTQRDKVCVRLDNLGYIKPCGAGEDVAWWKLTLIGRGVAEKLKEEIPRISEHRERTPR